MEGVETVDDQGSMWPLWFDASSGPRRLEIFRGRLLQSEVVRQLWMDPVLVALAEQALGCMPVLDLFTVCQPTGIGSTDERDRAGNTFIPITTGCVS